MVFNIQKKGVGDMEYQACLNYFQEHCRPGIPGGFQRAKRMAELLGNPQEALRTIHIAGTNGKGSTAAVLEAILRQAGYQVGLYTSPHLECYEERIQINRQLISRQCFAQIMTRLIKEIVPQIQAEGLNHPGEFELLTVASWLYFRNKTDFVLSEVGMGGTLDPTNVIQNPVLTVLTPIGLDHCQILGHTVAEIAGEKAGILKRGVPTISAPQVAEAEDVIRKIANEKQAPLFQLHVETLQSIETNLPGSYQQMNCNTALAAVDNLRQRGLLTVTEQHIHTALQQVFWPGRMEYMDLGKQKGILLDGAHNPAGMACLAKNLRYLYAEREIILFLAILDDKEQDAMMKEILPLVSQVILTKPEHDQRAQHWLQLQQWMQPHIPCQVYENYQDGLQKTVLQLQPGQLLCITGSLYLLGDCRRFLRTILSIL